MAWNSKKKSSRTLFQSKSPTQVEIKKKNIFRYAQYIHVTNSYANIWYCMLPRLVFFSGDKN